MDYSSDSTELSVDPDQPVFDRLNGNAKYLDGDHSLVDKLCFAASSGQVDSVKQLIIAGATFGSDTMGYTPLHRAAAQGHTEVVRVLTEAGCCIDFQDYLHGNTALHEAAWNGYSRTLQLLITSGANVQLLNKGSFSALHLAAQNGHNQSARILLYSGCNTQHKNNYGDTALHTAARYGHAGVTRILIGARCNVNDSNKNYDTALHIAAALKRDKIAKLLLNAGVNVTIKNKQGEYALDVAQRKQHTEIVGLLEAHLKEEHVRGQSCDRMSSDQKFKSSKASVEDMEAGGNKKKNKRFFFRSKKTKDKQSDSESEKTIGIQQMAPLATPSVDSRLMPPPATFRQTAEQLVLGFRLHRLKQQQQSGRLPDVMVVPAFSRPKREVMMYGQQVAVANHCHQHNMRNSSPAGQLRSLSPDALPHDIEQHLANHLNFGLRHRTCHEQAAVGGRLVRSRSDETLSSVSMLITRHKQSPVKCHQHQDTVNHHSKQVIQNRMSDGRSATGDKFIENLHCSHYIRTVPANVVDWLARNEALTSTRYVTSTGCRPSNVHDL